jgi:hypothetical protein
MGRSSVKSSVSGQSQKVSKVISGRNLIEQGCCTIKITCRVCLGPERRAQALLLGLKFVPK